MDGYPVTALGRDDRKRLLDLTRVGKTDLAKALAEELFSNEKALVRIDMSEHVGASSVTSLIGSPPGNICLQISHDMLQAPGYENGGQLTEQEMRRPYSVILDDGRLTDAKGRAVDFTNTIIIMTSNLGAHHLDGYPDNDAARERILADVRRHFRPELVNRLDEMVVFQPLSSSSAGDQLLRKVARLQLKGVALRLAGKGIDLDVTDAALDVMLSETRGEVKMYGARPIRRFVQKVVVTRISNMVVREEVHEDCCISIDADEEVKELVFTVTKKPADQKK
uniref:Clp ATPase C-terminal domain-containing protein n=1 Tax=Setaria italica TaxID=4555 RepID=K4AKZ5_SETIT